MLRKKPLSVAKRDNAAGAFRERENSACVDCGREARPRDRPHPFLGPTDRFRARAIAVGWGDQEGGDVTLVF